jgi:ubiquinone/menaquinone biosynthesis C-methylase UbiE
MTEAGARFAGALADFFRHNVRKTWCGREGFVPLRRQPIRNAAAPIDQGVTGQLHPQSPEAGAPAETFETRWRQRFNEFAELRDDDAGVAGWTPTGLEARVRRFVALWSRGRPGDLWLDAGCGAGTYARLLLDNGLEVVGVDYSLLALRKARMRSSANIQYVVSDLRHLPFRREVFDGVICFGVTQALSESGSALRELAALAKPESEVWVDALNRWCIVHVYDFLKRRIRGRPMHLRYESPREMMRLMADSGFDNVRLHWMPILPSRSQRFQVFVESRIGEWAYRFVPLLGLIFCHAFIVTGRKRRG